MNEGPLHGLRIAVTRPAHGADELAARLGEAGAVAVSLPLVRITGPHDAAPLQRALDTIDDYDWIVFTSATAAAYVARAAARRATPLPAPRAHIAAVGAATAAAVARELGWHAHVVPADATGESVVPAMRAHGELRGRRVLWPRARAARDTVRRELEAAGALLDDPETYGTYAVPEAAAELAERLAHDELAALTLTSPSAVAALMAAQPRIGRCVVAVIGPTTAAAARAAGLPVHIEPEQHTIPALVEELVRFFTQSREPD